MIFTRKLKPLIAGCSLALLAGCQTAPPPPMIVPAAFTPLGTAAPYLLGDVIGGYRARAAKMRAAKIRPLAPREIGPYMADLDSELRRQTAGIGLDVLQVSGSIVVRIPATFTFDEGSASVKATTDATLLEIARTVKTRNRTFVDVLAHTDLTGRAQGSRVTHKVQPSRREAPSFAPAARIASISACAVGSFEPRIALRVSATISSPSVTTAPTGTSPAAAASAASSRPRRIGEGSGKVMAAG